MNVFMYAAGADHPLKEPCLRILADVESGIIEAVINTEIFQELLYRYNRIKVPAQGVRLCREVLEYPLRVLSVTEADVRLAVELFDVHGAAGLKPRDAVHAATMQNNNISRIITADKDFDLINSLHRIDPTAYPLP